MASVENLAVLLELGKTSSYDPTQLRLATILSMASHVSLLKANGVPISDLGGKTKSELETIINNLKTRKGIPLTPGYKTQIAATIKRLIPNSQLEIKYFKKNAYAYSQTRATSTKLMSGIESLLKAASKYVNSKFTTEITDIGEYECCIAIMLTTATCLRIKEITQLKLSDIPLILNYEPINIRSKSRENNRLIAPNDLLALILDIIQKQRDALAKKLTNDFNDKHRIERYKLGFIILSSTTNLLHRLKEFAALNHIDIPVLGFNLFRKYTSTILMQQGAHSIAQTLNNHTTANTTATNYSLNTTQDIQDVYNQFDTPPPSVLPQPMDS